MHCVCLSHLSNILYATRPFTNVCLSMCILTSEKRSAKKMFASFFRSTKHGAQRLNTNCIIHILYAKDHLEGFEVLNLAQFRLRGKPKNEKNTTG